MYGGLAQEQAVLHFLGAVHVARQIQAFSRELDEVLLQAGRKQAGVQAMFLAQGALENLDENPFQQAAVFASKAFEGPRGGRVLAADFSKCRVCRAEHRDFLGFVGAAGVGIT